MRSLKNRVLSDKNKNEQLAVTPVISSQSMKRFLAFYGDIYEPNGGMKDFIGSFDSIDECKDVIEVSRAADMPDDHEYNYCWGQIYDCEAMKIVFDTNP